MTSGNDQLQAMIAEIDAVLRKASPRLPWVMSGDVERQRRVLERVRSYLVSLQPSSPGAAYPGSANEQTPHHRQRPEASGPRRSLLGADISSPGTPFSATPETSPSPYRGGVTPGSLNQQILQAVVQDLRNSLMAPIQGELEALQRQRSDLLGEIRQLENQRQQDYLDRQAAGQQQLMREFLQVLTERLQESMTQQVAQILKSLEAEAVSYIGELDPSSDSRYPSHSLLTPSDRLAQMRMLQAESDQLLMKLDSSIAVVFETVQKNINSYQESLSQGIDKMYSLGHQGEVMFSALINNLAEELGREASSFVQSRPESRQTASESSRLSGKKVAESGLQLPKGNVPEQKPEIAQPEELSWSETSLLASQEIEGFSEKAPDGSEPTRARKRPPAAGARTDSSTQSQVSEALELLEKLNINQIAPRQEKSGEIPLGADVSSDSEQTQTNDRDDDDGLFDAMFGPESLATDSESLTQSNQETDSESSSSSETSINKTATLAEDLLAESEEIAPEVAPETSRSLEDWLFAEEEGSGTERGTGKGAIDDLAEIFPDGEDLEESTENEESSELARANGVDPEDVYIPASPEENLLPTEDTEEDRDQTWLSLNPIAIQKLNEDLGNLEKEPRLSQVKPDGETAVVDEESDEVSSAGIESLLGESEDSSDWGRSETEVTESGWENQTSDIGGGEEVQAGSEEAFSEFDESAYYPELDSDWGLEEPEEDPDPTWISLEPITPQQLNAALGRSKLQESAAKKPESASRQSRATESSEDGGWDDRGWSQTEATRLSSEELQAGSEYVDDGLGESEDSAGIESEDLSTDVLPESSEDWELEEPEEDPDPTWISLEPITQQQLNAALGREKSLGSAAKNPASASRETGSGPGEVRSQEVTPEKPHQTPGTKSESNRGLENRDVPDVSSGATSLLDEGMADDASLDENIDDLLLERSAGTDSQRESKIAVPSQTNDWGFDDWDGPDVESGATSLRDEEMASPASSDGSIEELLGESSAGTDSQRESKIAVPSQTNDWGFDDWDVPDVSSGATSLRDEEMASPASSDGSIEELLGESSAGIDSQGESKIAVPSQTNDWGFDDWDVPDVESQKNRRSVGKEEVQGSQSEMASQTDSQRESKIAVPSQTNDWGFDDWDVPDVEAQTSAPEQKLSEEVSQRGEPLARENQDMTADGFDDLFADVLEKDSQAEQKLSEEVSQRGEPLARENQDMTADEFDDLFADVPEKDSQAEQKLSEEVSQRGEPLARENQDMTADEFDDLFADLQSTDSQPEAPRDTKAEVKTGNMKPDEAFADFTADPITPKQGRSASPKQMKTQKKKRAD